VSGAAIASLAITAHAGLLDQLISAVTTTNSTATASSALSQDQMAGGSKEALGKGMERAVSSLGHPCQSSRPHERFAAKSFRFGNQVAPGGRFPGRDKQGVVESILLDRPGALCQMFG